MATINRDDFVRIDAAVSQVGVALYACRGWVVSAHLRHCDEGFISINIGETPWLLSLFYGLDRTLDSYLEREKSFFDRQIKVLERAEIVFKSKQAIRLILRSQEPMGRAYSFDQGGQLEHHPEHVERTYSHHLFLVHRGRNLQIGYKLEEHLLAEYQPLVEEALTRIEFLEGPEESSAAHQT